MPLPDQSETVTWRDGTTPVSTLFDDPYYSLAGGLDETRHVFLAGNDLPARFDDGFHVAEIGFGTGLNLIATILAWRETSRPGILRYTSFEAYPISPDDMRRAHAAFPETGSVSAQIVESWASGARSFDAFGVAIDVITGDARTTLPDWADKADAWFLDGFSPARNPELWGDTLMSAVARHTRPGGTFATYTAAGFVRRALLAAGFHVERRAGYGTKRHMTRGVLPAATGAE